MKSIKRTRLISFLLALLMTLALTAQVSAATSATPPTATTVAATEYAKLKTLNWVPETRAALNTLMRDYGKFSADYNPRQKPYVVFDFDNTTSFFDVEEALLIYQLQNLRFKVPKDKMYDVLTTAVPTDNFVAEYSNSEGQRLNVEIVARDCQTAYEWLVDNYVGFGQGGKMVLYEINKTPQYKDFITKVRFLYDAIGDTFDASVSYPWVTYLFTGMTSAEVRALATESHDYWLAYDKWETVYWVCPEGYKSEAGRVQTSFKTSIALPPESVDLYQKLQQNGFDVYVCSASFIDVIEALAYNPKYGLNVPEGNVYAMMLKKDSRGRYINQYDDDYFQTQGPGKRETIDKFIAPGYGGRGPIFVAGDSQGDYNMITEYEDMKLGLIINRVRGDDFQIISKQAAETFGQPGAKYVLQGRDENKGVYIPTQESIMLGKTEPQLVRS